MKIILRLLFLVSLLFISCKSTKLKLTEKEDGLYVSYYNCTNQTVHIPKIYFSMFSNENNKLLNNVFEIYSDQKEEAWYRGIVSNIILNDYEETPEAYFLIAPYQNIEFKVCKLNSSYIFENDYKYVFIRYKGYLGVSNKIRISKQFFLEEP